MDLTAIQLQLDHERRHLARAGETITQLPDVTRLQADWGHSITWASLTQANADTVIARELAHHRELGVGFEWTLYGYDRPADLLERLAKHGLAVGPCEAVMVFVLADPAPWMNLAIPGCRISRIDRPEQVSEYQRVAEEVFARDHAAVASELAAALEARNAGYRGYLAYLGDEPASVGRLHTHPNSAFGGLYGGGTRPAHRGRGVYRALVAARARDAIQMGARYLRVDALPTSRPILKQLGFQCLTQTWPCQWAATSHPSG